MELLTDSPTTQILFPAAAVVVVLICAALVFSFGFKSAEQPEFGKSPLLLDDRKTTKKRKTKEKKSAGTVTQGSGAKPKSTSTDKSKKSPSKDKTKDEEKAVKTESESPVKKEETKPAVKKAETKPTVKKEETKNYTKEEVKNEEPKQQQKKKSKQHEVYEKPEDFDEGEWETVPIKTVKKKTTKTPEENEAFLNNSPVKDSKKKAATAGKKDIKKDEKPNITVASMPTPLADEPEEDEAEIQRRNQISKELQEQVIRVQNALREAEKRDFSPPVMVVSSPLKFEKVLDVAPKLTIENKEDKKKKDKVDENKIEAPVDKEIKKTSVPKKPLAEKKPISEPERTEENLSKEASPKATISEDAVVFDELGDALNDSKSAKKSKKKVRKD